MEYVEPFAVYSSASDAYGERVMEYDGSIAAFVGRVDVNGEGFMGHGERSDAHDK